MVKQTNPDGSSSTNAYNLDGEPTASTDANGNLTLTYFDAAGNVIKTIAGAVVGGEPGVMPICAGEGACARAGTRSARGEAGIVSKANAPFPTRSRAVRRV